MGIPWDHWDGYAHGDVKQRAKGLFFKGHIANYMVCRRAMGQTIMPQLGAGYQLATHVSPSPDRASRRAHKAKVVLLTYARAQLGDDYLAALYGLSPGEFQRLMEALYVPEPGAEWTHTRYPGYQHTNIYDEIVTEYATPKMGRASLYIGGWDN